MNFSLEKVLLLKKIPVFSAVSESALSDFISVCEEKAFSKGKVILHAGQTNDSLYIVLTGCVQITDGKDVLCEAGAQEIFGEVSALSPSPLVAQVVAIEDSVVLCITHTRLYEIMALHTEIAQGIIKTLANRLKVLDNRHI